MPAAAGHNANLSFDIESSFADGGGGDPDPFGLDANLSTAEASNNAHRTYEPGSRDASQILAGPFEGSFSVEFTLTNPFWIPTAISGSGGDYTGETPETMTIFTGTGHYDRALVGCAVSSASISVSTEEVATVTLDGFYADESDETGTQPAVQYTAMQSFDSTLSIDGTTREIVQDVDFSIENNSDPVRGLGSRHPQDYSPKQREISIDFTEIVNTSDNISNFYGGTTPSTNPTTSDFVLEFDDGGSNAITFNADAAMNDTFANDGIGDPEADLTESLTAIPATVSATATGFGFATT